MKKLTNAQQKVYDELVGRVTEARECKNYDEYWSKHYKAIQDRYKPSFEKYYIQALNGISGVYRAKHETLRKLEKLGLVRIVDIELNVIQLVEE